MRKCNKCNISFNGYLRRCPLCECQLSGKYTENVFPRVAKLKSELLYKILLFISFSVGVLFSFVEYNLTGSFMVSKLVVLGLISNYILIRFILKNYKNIFKMMNKYFRVILILFFVWYLVIKSLIITTYLIPILCLIIFVFNSITMLVLRDNYILKFTKTILGNCFIGVIPLVLVYLKLTTFDLLSYICVIVDLLVFVGLLIFCKESIIEEFQKIFNF